MKSYPALICWPCAEAALRKREEHPVPMAGVTTYRLRCEACGRETTVADPVDFGSPEFEGFAEAWRA